jgi:hypothetical protein
LKTTANANVRSYGVYFLSQLLKSANLREVGDVINMEDLDDERFNVRDTNLGLNMDFMSYANYVRANSSSTALLDADTLREHTQQTFQTFFAHYASTARWIDGQKIVYDELTGEGEQGQKVNVTISEPIEVLAMTQTATWLSLGILFVLMLILVILIVSLKIVYPRTILQHKVECLADVIAMVEGSENLLACTEQYDARDLKKSGIKTRLGWFRNNRTGVTRWGIEVDGADGVEWVERPEKPITRELAKSVV